MLLANQQSKVSVECVHKLLVLFLEDPENLWNMLLDRHQSTQAEQVLDATVSLIHDKIVKQQNKGGNHGNNDKIMMDEDNTYRSNAKTIMDILNEPEPPFVFYCGNTFMDYER